MIWKVTHLSSYGLTADDAFHCLQSSETGLWGGTERSGLHNSSIFGKARKTKSWLLSQAEHRGKKGLGSRGDQEPDGQSIQTSDEGNIQKVAQLEKHSWM